MLRVYIYIEIYYRIRISEDDINGDGSWGGQNRRGICGVLLLHAWNS